MSTETYDLLVETHEAALVPIDFNGIFAAHTVLLNTLGVEWGLARIGLTLTEGMRLRGYDFDSEGNQPDNLVTEGTVARWNARDEEPPVWVLSMDYLKHQSDLTDQSDHWAHQTNFTEVDAALIRRRDENPLPAISYHAAQRASTSPSRG